MQQTSSSNLKVKRLVMSSLKSNKSWTPHSQTSIGRTIAVMSNKGGVGKSTITGLLATHLTKIGRRVGILDADIIGPTISRLFGVTEPIRGQNGVIIPAKTPTGIHLISSQLLLEKMDDPIVWRFPLVLDLIRQFYVDVVWGQLDDLIIDLPPGTGDVTMTVLESLNVDGIIMITTPQDMIQSLVAKGIQMAKLIHKPIFGVIENYSYFQCDACQKRHELFGSSVTNKLWEMYDLRLLGQLPILSELPAILDHGKIETIMSHEMMTIVEQLKE
jgi:Mrp family chromosome partitioning ATPase